MMVAMGDTLSACIVRVCVRNTPWQQMLVLGYSSRCANELARRKQSPVPGIKVFLAELNDSTRTMVGIGGNIPALHGEVPHHTRRGIRPTQGQDRQKLLAQRSVDGQAEIRGQTRRFEVHQTAGDGFAGLE